MKRVCSGHTAARAPGCVKIELWEFLGFLWYAIGKSDHKPKRSAKYGGRGGGATCEWSLEPSRARTPGVGKAARRNRAPS